MSVDDDNHAGTPAAWIAVAVIVIGFIVGGAALIAASVPTFFIGVALIAVGAIFGKVTAVMARTRT